MAEPVPAAKHATAENAPSWNWISVTNATRYPNRYPNNAAHIGPGRVTTPAYAQGMRRCLLARAAGGARVTPDVMRHRSDEGAKVLAERRTPRRAAPGIPAPSERDQRLGPCTRRRHGRHEVVLAFDSGQAPLRHTRLPAESCFLPDLTRFTGSRCAGPDPQRLVRVVPCGGPSLGRGFSPPYVGLG